MEPLWYLYIPLTLALYFVAKNFLTKLQNLPPSPFPSFPLIGHLHLVKKPLQRSLAKISDRYGPIVFLQLGFRRVLVVSSPSAVEECLSKHDVLFANRPRLLAGKHFGYNYTSLAWTSYGDHWRNLRRISSIEILSTNRLQMLHAIRFDEVRSMVRKLFLASKSGQPVDMKTVFFELMLNVMMRMIAGKRYYGDNVEDAQEASRFREIVAETFRLGGASNIGDFLPMLSWVGGTEKKLEALQEKRDTFMKEMVEQQRKRMKNEGDESSGKKRTLIEVLLSLQESEPEYYTDQIIRSIMLVLLAAGTDTSVGSMEWALSLMLNNPQVLQKAQSEIDDCVGHDRLVDEPDLADLPYLRCIMNETFRMYPAGPLLLPHESSESCTVGGYNVPGGTLLLVNLWAIQNDPKYWAEPRKFKPERFEGMEGVRDGYKLMPFGSGRRGCPGESLALRMVGTGLGAVIQCFDWKTVGDGMVDMTEGTGLTLPKAKPLVAYCQARQEMLSLLSQL